MHSLLIVFFFFVVNVCQLFCFFKELQAKPSSRYDLPLLFYIKLKVHYNTLDYLTVVMVSV